MNYKLYLIIWPNPRAGKMKQILWADWLPERTKTILLSLSIFTPQIRQAPAAPWKKTILNNADADALDSMNCNRRCFLLFGKLPFDESSL